MRYNVRVVAIWNELEVVIDTGEPPGVWTRTRTPTRQAPVPSVAGTGNLRVLTGFVRVVRVAGGHSGWPIIGTHS